MALVFVSILIKNEHMFQLNKIISFFLDFLDLEDGTKVVPKRR